LGQRGLDGVTVVGVLLQVERSENHAVGFTDHERGLGAKLVFFVRLALGQTVDVGLVQRVDFVPVVAFLREHPPAQGEDRLMAMTGGQLALQFTHQPTGDGF